MRQSVGLRIVAGQPTGLLVGGAGRIVYIMMKETTGTTAAAFSLYDGAISTGNLIVPYDLLANESTRDSWPTHGIPYEGDLYFSADSGSVAGSIYVVPESLWDIWTMLATGQFEQAALQGLT